MKKKWGQDHDTNLHMRVLRQEQTRGSGFELSVFLRALDDLAHGRVMNPQESANRAEGITVLKMRNNDLPVFFLAARVNILFSIISKQEYL